MYIHLHNGQISCLIPEEDANFPGVSIKKRYSPEFLSGCIVKDDSYIKKHNLHAGMAYDAETDTFSEPKKVEIPLVTEEEVVE